MTQTDYLSYLARRGPRKDEAVGGDKSEAKLHGAILTECKRQGWLVLHGSMGHETKRTVGEPDFVILRENARVLFVECKSKTGKLSPEQAALHCWAAHLGHQIHIVRSLADFLALI